MITRLNNLKKIRKAVQFTPACQIKVDSIPNTYRSVLFGIVFFPGSFLTSTLSAMENPYPLPYQCPVNKSQRTPGIRIVEKKSQPLGQLEASAEHIKRNGKKAILDGEVKISQGDMTITAKNATIDRDKQFLEAKNGLRFQSSQIAIGSDYLKIDLDNNIINIKDAFYQLKEQSLRGKAGELQISGKGKFSMEDASFSSCPPDHEVWAVKADKIIIDPEKGRGEARNMTLRIQDIPIIYLPYIQFPASDKRISGLLVPTFGSSSQNGQEIAIPYYWNIAPNYDATITPRYLSERGVQLMSEFRYLGENSVGTVTAEYLGGDDKATASTPEDRYRFRLKHLSQFNQNWKANIDYEAISDDNYFFDLGGDLSSSSIIEINRQASVEFNDDNWHIRAITSSDQTLNTLEGPYRRLPQIQWQSQFPISSLAKTQFNFNGELAAFDRDNAITANRLVIEPAISYPLDWLAGYIHPKLKYNYRNYRQKDPLGGAGIDKTISTPIVSVDTGAYLERNIRYNDKKYLQTLEPRLYYLYVPAREQQQIQLYDSFLKTVSYQQLFQDNRYSGYDRLGDANQISLGVNTRILESDTGEEILSFGIGQAYFLTKRKVSLQSVPGNIFNVNEDLQANTSPLLADLIMNISKSWRINATFEWQPDTNRTKSSSFRFQYQPNELNVVNLGHRRRIIASGENIEQLDFSFSWKIHRNWRLIGRWYQDITNNKNIETLFGAEYDSCCWAIRIVNRRYLSVPLSPTGFPIPGSSGNYNGGPSIQFVLKGLSSLGGSSYLGNSISGYRDPYEVIGH